MRFQVSSFLHTITWAGVRVDCWSLSACVDKTTLCYFQKEVIKYALSVEEGRININKWRVARSVSTHSTNTTEADIEARAHDY
ncbi:hypothetical protein GGR55DRAFT_653552 [Xylaria sp. FL0064]|nr:hypothetical protein GGR55DRAFT_653552 [Xylaria sp. FL0064]